MLKIPYNVYHIPLVHKTKRPGNKITPTSITIHATANPTSTAINERNWLVNPSNDRQASWHLVVDEKEVIEAIPLNERAFHAGTSAGNNTSISIEICESGDRARTIQNAVDLTVKLLHERGWGVDRLKRHFDWSKKACPRILMANNWEGWKGFVIQVERELTKLNNQVKVNFQGKAFTTPGYVEDGKNYVQIRDVFEKAGFKVSWNQATQTVVIE